MILFLLTAIIGIIACCFSLVKDRSLAFDYHRFTFRVKKRRKIPHPNGIYLNQFSLEFIEKVQISIFISALIAGKMHGVKQFTDTV